VVPMAKKEEAPRLYQGYNPKKSVFPAEACDEQGGEACEAEFGEEVKPRPTAAKEQKKDGKGLNLFGKKQPDREYQDYKGDKTVFQDEACDDLGGEFCEAEK